MLGWCWHKWGRWSSGDVDVYVPLRNRTVRETIQWRRCAKCEKIRVREA
jgi:hypothetical protein